MNERFMNEAVIESRCNEVNNYQDGGPFGAVIVKDGVIIARGHNTVIKDEDPTAHAEVNAIREAARVLGTHDLSGTTIYASSEPCPMCLSAIIWANIKTAYYANTREDAGDIGFRDDLIYDFIKSNNSDVTTLDLKRIESNEALQVFKDFKNNKDKTMY